MYLQIHKKYQKHNKKYFLAFRVGWISGDNNKKKIRQDLHERLMRTLTVKNHEWSGKVDRPQSYGFGKTMNFCETSDQDCWLAKNNKGKIDLEKTVENLKKAEKILDEAVKDLRKKTDK